jgi:hypothetical protein
VVWTVHYEFGSASVKFEQLTEVKVVSYFAGILITQDDPALVVRDLLIRRQNGRIPVGQRESITHSGTCVCIYVWCTYQST